MMWGEGWVEKQTYGRVRIELGIWMNRRMEKNQHSLLMQIIGWGATRRQ